MHAVHPRDALHRARRTTRRTPHPLRRLPLITCLVTAFMTLPACGQQSGKPLLSAEARRLVEEEGVAATRQQLGMLAMTGRDSYEVDLDGMISLGREYTEAGKGDAAVTVLQVAILLDMTSAEAQVALADAYVAQGTPAMATMYYRQALQNDPQNADAREGLVALGEEIPPTPGEEAARREAERREMEAADAAIDRDRGARRDDLERFKGRYADPDRAIEHHVFWIAETCAGSGYLVAGAEWGDVAPWILRSESETHFHQVFANPGQSPLEFEFELAADGTPRAVVMTGLSDAPTRLERLGPLREGWQLQGEGCRVDRPGS